MRELSSLEKKAELKLAKKLKPKTHFTLNEVLMLMEHHRHNSSKLDEMEKSEFISIINTHFEFNDKVILDRLFQIFNCDKVLTSFSNFII